MSTSTPKPGARTATSRRSQTTRRKPARKARAAARRVTYSTSTQPKTRVEQVQQLAERAVLVPVGASLLVRDDFASTVRGITARYRTRAGVERELKRFERRGTTARNRLERQVRRTRTRFERELRQRRSRVERSVKQNRRRFEREVRSVRRDLEKQSQKLLGAVS